jgi:AcrR family transcriptional regulator
MANPNPNPASHPDRPEASSLRQRILDAAFTAFVQQGYAESSTLDIATRARVSKRELYAVIGNKQEMLVACITERARRMRLPADLPAPHDRAGLADTLSAFGAQLLREVCDPSVLAVFRLAIAEAVRTPRIAEALDSIGREASRASFRKLLQNARAFGLVDGDVTEMSHHFFGLLWGDLLVSLLLRVSKTPSQKEIQRRAKIAADGFLKLWRANE